MTPQNYLCISREALEAITKWFLESDRKLKTLIRRRFCFWNFAQKPFGDSF